MFQPSKIGSFVVSRIDCKVELLSFAAACLERWYSDWASVIGRSLCGVLFSSIYRCGGVDLTPPEWVRARASGLFPF